jgi:hypothetical protein
VVVTELGVVEVSPDQANLEFVGEKALGLLTIPPDWIVPFFVVLDKVLSGDCSQEQLQMRLDEACRLSGVGSNNVMVRSNGIEEGSIQRGALTSSTSTLAQTAQTLVRLHAAALEVTTTPTHWIVQNEVSVHARGQLSNERRVRYEKRDWAEIDPVGSQNADQISMAVRRWRDGQDVAEGRLDCNSFLNLSLTLKKVAIWAVQDKRRFLFEWVWDGKAIYLVQMDVASSEGGERPKDLLPAKVSQPFLPPLTVFASALPEHKSKFRKLSNASLYERLGYEMPPFTFSIVERNYLMSSRMGPFPIIYGATWKHFVSVLLCCGRMGPIYPRLSGKCSHGVKSSVARMLRLVGYWGFSFENSRPRPG